DQIWDLVVAASDGSVVWFKNEGDAKQPKFGASRALLPARAPDKSLTQYVEPGQAPSQGVRAQICATDFDCDGRPDLLLGDYSRIIPLRKLTAAERTEFDAVR